MNFIVQELFKKERGLENQIQKSCLGEKVHIEIIIFLHNIQAVSIILIVYGGDEKLFFVKLCPFCTHCKRKNVKIEHRHNATLTLRYIYFI